MINNTKISEEKVKTKRISKINGYEIAEYVLSFCLNKICLFGTLSPFGLSYFASAFPMHEMSFGPIAAFLGILLAGFGVTTLKYIGGLSLYLIFTILCSKNLSDKKWILALASSASLFVSGSIFVFMDGLLMYDMMLLMLECILCFVSFFAFNRASILLRTIKSRKTFEPSDVLSIVFLFSVFLLAIINIPECEPLAHIVSVSAILLIAYSSGSMTACSAGVLFGIVQSFTSPLPAQVICTYTISAFCSGCLRKYGKVGVGFGFLAANALVMIYLNSSSITIINIVCTLTSVFIILMLPKNFIKKISSLINTPVATFCYSSCDREITAHKIDKASKSCLELSRLFDTITQNNIKSNELTPGVIFDNTIESVCRNCNLCTYCWHKNYDKTVEAISDMYDSMSERGYAVEFDAPSSFRAECIKFDDFLDSVNRNYEIQKINLSWASKVFESKNIVAQQFKNISGVLNNLKEQVVSGYFRDESLENKIKAELDRKNICVKSVRVICSDNYEIFITLPSCGNRKICRTIIPAAIGTALGFPVFQEERNCGKEQCILKYREQTNFSIEVGFAKTSDNSTGTSGDSHLFLPLPDGKYLLCLSDGMGRGFEAEHQSSLTVKLIKKLLQLGFDKETSLKIINSFLLLKSTKETFATADICIFNLTTGALEFIKSGAVNSYIKTKDKTHKIKCSSLPAGAISALDADCELIYAKDGDFVVMVSDGITDILERQDENILKHIIEEYNGTTSQNLADHIIKTALSMKPDNSFDDMTVLVAKIFEEV